MLTGTRTSSTIVPPSAVNVFLNCPSASYPGPKSATSMNAFLIPFLNAQLAIGAEFCGRVIDARTMYGDLVVIEEVAAFITTMGFFACAETGAAAKADGVSANPARMSTLSLITSSCAIRLLTSPEVPGLSSLTTSSTRRPPSMFSCSAR